MRRLLGWPFRRQVRAWLSCAMTMKAAGVSDSADVVGGSRNKEHCAGSPVAIVTAHSIHLTACGSKVRIKLDGPKASAVLVGNILHIPPTIDEDAAWQPLLLEVRHHDEKGRLHTISLLPDHAASAPPDAAMQVCLWFVVHCVSKRL